MQQAGPGIGSAQLSSHHGRVSLSKINALPSRYSLDLYRGLQSVMAQIQRPSSQHTSCTSNSKYKSNSRIKWHIRHPNLAIVPTP